MKIINQNNIMKAMNLMILIKNQKKIKMMGKMKALY